MSDREAIDAVIGEYAAAVSANDPDRWINIFSDDVVFMAPDVPQISGKKALLDFSNESFFGLFDLREEIRMDGLDIGDSWAYGRGAFTVWATPKGGGEEMLMPGKFVAGFKQVADGKWRWSSVAFNYDSPPGDGN